MPLWRLGLSHAQYSVLIGDSHTRTPYPSIVARRPIIKTPPQGFVISPCGGLVYLTQYSILIGDSHAFAPYASVISQRTKVSPRSRWNMYSLSVIPTPLRQRPPTHGRLE